MVRWLLFLHVISVALWLGAAWSAWVLVRRARTQNTGDGWNLAATVVRSIVRGIINPSALLALVSGVGMMVHMDLMGPGKPFWLAFMEMFGGLVIMLLVGYTSWRLRALARAEIAAEQQLALNRLSPALSLSGLAVMGVILVVMLRLT